MSDTTPTNNTISLILGIHNHQPVDNWDHVIEEAYEKCYRPFLDTLKRFPSIKMSIHNTGYLLDWLEKHHPDLITEMVELHQQGQVELFGGGYYEPVLATIPDCDKQGQLNKLSNRIEALCGDRPTGMWLAERVWEPHLVKPIAEAGLAYLFLDDSHFKAVGLDETDLYGRYISEEQGHTVAIFPVDKTLRYMIPFEKPERIIEHLLQLAQTHPGQTAIYFDDGEKFGVWPGTYQSVYKQKWLETFFALLEQHSDVIKTVLPKENVSQSAPLGRIYLPTASYSEMLEWSLPAPYTKLYSEGLETLPDTYSRFFRGGFWRHFLVKYPEANQLHKKMLRVSQKLQKINPVSPTEKELHTEALDHLWQGQSNDVFWHGVFGGLYLTNLRTGNYKHLVQADALADRLTHGAKTPYCHCDVTDITKDGIPDVVIDTPTQSFQINPAEGGALVEWDYRSTPFNLTDTLARRYEAYHDKLISASSNTDEADGSQSIHDISSSKESGLDKHLHYDWHRRLCWLDHFLGDGTTLDKLYRSDYPEQGDFINSVYDCQTNTHQNRTTVTLKRDGHVWADGVHQPVRIEKHFTVDGHVSQSHHDTSTSTLHYVITNHGDDSINLWFAPEWNINFLAGNAPDRFYTIRETGGQRTKGRKLASKNRAKTIDGVGIVDEWLGLDVELTFNKPADLFHFPIETVSQSESGYERVYQSSALYPNWHLTLAPNESWSTTITQTIQPASASNYSADKTNEAQNAAIHT